MALSFPGEVRPFVESVANELATSLGRKTVFYDRYHEAELARPNLDTYLQRIYRDDSDLIVVFICQDYDEKDWCHLEARAIRDLIKRRKDDEVMFVRVDDGDVAGVFSVDGYIDAKERKPSEIAEVIVRRLQILRERSAAPATAPTSEQQTRGAVAEEDTALRIYYAGDARRTKKRPIIIDLKSALSAGGDLADSYLGPIVFEELDKESELEPSATYHIKQLVSGIQASDEYYARVRNSAGIRDWQHDFAQATVPLIVAVAHCCPRDSVPQAVVIRLCDMVAQLLKLKLRWPTDIDEANNLKNAIYDTCLAASELESDAVLKLLQRVIVEGPE